MKTLKPVNRLDGAAILGDVKAALGERAQLVKRIGQIDQMFAPISGSKKIPLGAGRRTRRPMSAAAKAKLSAVAKLRWKKAKKAGRTRL